MREEFEFMEEITPDVSRLPTEYKYVEVEVSKMSCSVVYLKVPEDYDWKDIITKCRSAIRKESELIDRFDWDDSGTEYEVEGIKEVDEKEATLFGYTQVD